MNLRAAARPVVTADNPEAPMTFRDLRKDLFWDPGLVTIGAAAEISRRSSLPVPVRQNVSGKNFRHGQLRSGELARIPPDRAEASLSFEKSAPDIGSHIEMGYRHSSDGTPFMEIKVASRGRSLRHLGQGATTDLDRVRRDRKPEVG